MKYIFFAAIVFGVQLSFAQQQLPVLNVDSFLSSLNEKKADVTVVNFWATWCGPCIKELPLFEALTAKNDPSVEVVLVSLDLAIDPNPDKVKKFVDRKKLQSEVLLLDEQDPDSWINKISEQWSGALPATLVINNKTGKRKFVEKQLHEGDLEELIDEVKTN